MCWVTRRLKPDLGLQRLGAHPCPVWQGGVTHNAGLFSASRNGECWPFPLDSPPNPREVRRPQGSTSARQKEAEAAGPVSLRPAPLPEGVPSSDPAQLRASWGPQEVVWLSPDCVTRCHVLPGWVPQMLGGLSARVWQRMGLTQRGIHPAPSWGFVGTQAPRGGQRMLLLPCLTLSLPAGSNPSGIHVSPYSVENH